MSLYHDVKHIQLISALLEGFKQRDSYLYNFRCNICGDSDKNKRKARGYFYRQPNANYMSMKCHNCGESMKLSTYLKKYFPTQYSTYIMEKFEERNKPRRQSLPKMDFRVDEKKFRKDRTLLDMMLPSLDTLPFDHEAVEYCRKRKIPEKAYERLYYIDDVSKLGQLSQKYKDRIKGKEPRLLIPFYNENGRLEGVTCRALRDEALRYITIKISEAPSMVFGAELVDKSKTVYVTEGPLDSLFLPNAIAVGSTSLDRVKNLNMNKDSFVFILDNQPRNKEVCKQYKLFLKNGYKLMIWPSHEEVKDINNLAMEGCADIKSFVDENTYAGLTGLVKFNQWRKC